MKLHNFMYKLACARDLKEVKFIKDGKEIKDWGFSIELIWKNRKFNNEFDARFLFTNFGDNDGSESVSEEILEIDTSWEKSVLYYKLQENIGYCLQDVNLCNMYKDMDILIEYCEDINSSIDILDIKSITDEDMYIAINF